MVPAFLGVFAGIALAGSAPVPAPGIYLNSAGSPLIPLLENATRSIDIEIYTINDPMVHQLIRNALARKVRVRILKDPNPVNDKCNAFGSAMPASVDGSAGQNAECDELIKLIRDVRAAGGTFEPFNKANLCPNGGKPNGSGCYEHGKIALVDGQTALISTGNFDDTNLCIASENPSRCDRDYTVIENDPTVFKTLENIFESDLQGNSYDVRTLIPSSMSGVLTVSPYSLQPMIDFINSATRTLDIETQYIKDAELISAITSAASRGVKVNLTAASFCSFGTPSNYEVQAAQKTYSAFDRARVSSAMFNSSNSINGHPGYLHAKVMVVDGTRAWVGSENGSTESLTQNREYGIFFNDTTQIQSLLSIMQADHNSPNTESWNDSLNCVKDGMGSNAIVATPDTSNTVPTPVSTKTHRKKKPTPGY